MDWTKAKTVFIVVLLGLNIFLFINIIDQSGFYFLNNDVAENTREILRHRDVSLATRLPTNQIRAGRLVYDENITDVYSIVEYLMQIRIKGEYDNNNRTIWEEENRKILIYEHNRFEFIDNSPGTPLPLDDIQRVERILVKEINRMGFNNRKFVLDKTEQKDDLIEFTFLNSYNGGLLFNDNITFDVSNNGIHKISGVMKKILKVKTPGVVLSAHQILLSNEFLKGTVISAIDFGYMPIQEMNIEDSPVWRIKTEDGSIMYFDAIEGSRIMLN